MRVGLVQCRLETRSRAANIQAISAAIDRAAQAMPAPDLVILPGAVDTGGVMGGACQVNSEKFRSVSETIMWKAREWGVFIAVGLHSNEGNAAPLRTVVIDPDGDVVAQASGRRDSGDADELAAGSIWRSTLGDIGAVSPGPGPSSAGLGNGGHGLLWVWPAPVLTSAKQRRIHEEAVTRMRRGKSGGDTVFWCVVLPAESWG
ncbi:MAG: hypothetical protein KJ749_00060, partial [Planctomycetes bacterium]|nr:hypothetical protein [Planctomycetota bacterium]